MVFTGLTGGVLDRANRFLRLWSAAGLQMWELDWALEHPTGALASLDDFLVFLAGVVAVSTRLKLPVQESLNFWMPLETRDVTNHLGAEDAVALSTYSEVFRNPAVLASWRKVFVPLGSYTITAASNTSPIAITTALPHGYETGIAVSISGAVGNTAANGTFTITVTGPTSFTLNGSAGNGTWTSGGAAVASLSGNPIIPATPSASSTPELNAVAASLGLRANDITAVLAFTGAANALSLDTLNVLLRYQRLAASLLLNLADLILWIGLTAGTPFDKAPADTLEFLRRLTILQSTRIAVRDLDYLLRNQSASQSQLAFTPAQATALLQTIRDDIAKLSPPATVPVTLASDASPIAITSASPHGLQTGSAGFDQRRSGKHRGEWHFYDHSHRPYVVHAR